MGTLLALLAAAGVAHAQSESPAPAASGSASAGQAVFDAQCASCHTIGGGTLVGPDLQGVTDRRTTDWLEAWISDPQALIDSGDADAQQLSEQFGMVMPTLGLVPQQVSDVIADLAQSSAGGGPVATVTPSAAPSPTPVPRGDALAGEGLFTGKTSFQNAGPPCMACHSAGGLAALGGGTLGPNLSGSFQKMGASGVRSVLTNMPFPTMKAVWSSHPITPQEQEDIIAFLNSNVGKRAPEAVGSLFAASLQVALLLLLASFLILNRRLISVRRAMVKRAKRGARTLN